MKSVGGWGKGTLECLSLDKYSMFCIEHFVEL